MVQIPFALKNGEPVDIHQVEKGLACGCTCPECHSPLIARKGEQKVHHFAHQAGAVCQNAYETAIHIMAKKILMEEKHLQLPGLHISAKENDKQGLKHMEIEQVCEPRWIRFDEVKEEVTLGDIRADIVGYVNQRPLIIEIRVTHASGQNKKRYIRNQAWSAIEINLADLGYMSDRKVLEEHLLESTNNKYWLSHPRVPRIKQALKRKLKTIIEKENTAYELEIERARREQEKIAQKQARHYRQIPAAPLRPKREVPADQYATRFFICDHCRHHFEVRQDILNSHSSDLHCPRCKKTVSQLAP